jgi:hypothetical protein
MPCCSPPHASVRVRMHAMLPPSAQGAHAFHRYPCRAQQRGPPACSQPCLPGEPGYMFHSYPRLIMRPTADACFVSPMMLPALSGARLHACTAIAVTVVCTGCNGLWDDTLLDTRMLVSVRSLPVSFGIPCEVPFIVCTRQQSIAARTVRSYTAESLHDATFCNTGCVPVC